MCDALLWNEIGKIYQKIGSHEEAIAALTRATELDPKSGWAFYDLGHAYFLRGEYGRALFHLRKSIQLLETSHDQAVAWNRIGDTYRALKDIDNAVQAYRKADGLDMNAVPQAESAFTQPESIADLAQALKGDQPSTRKEDRPAGLFKTSASGDIKYLSQAASGDPPAEEKTTPAPKPVQDTAPVHTAVPVRVPPFKSEGAETPKERKVDASRRNDLEETLAKISIYENLTRVTPGNDRAWDTLGKLYKSLGRYDDAIAAYQMAIEKAPEKEVYYYYLGLLFTVQQRHDDAVWAFEHVLRRNPDYTLAHSALVGVYHRLGQEKEANNHISAALPKMNTESAYNRACFYALCGDTELSIEFLRLALNDKDTTVEWIKSDPDLETIRSDPRYLELIASQEDACPETPTGNYFSADLDAQNRLLPILNQTLAR